MIVGKRPPAPISVVIPAHNAERFLQEAVESVYAQSLSVLETIVVDNGSTDGTAALSTRLGVRVIRQGRSGTSVARNTGIRVADGEWIAFLDADDTWMPKKLAHQWQVAKRYPQIGIVSCDHCTYESDRLVEVSYLARLLDGRPPIRMAYVARHGLHLPPIDKHFFSLNWVLLPSTVMIRRRVLDYVGLFDVDLRGVEDYECFMRVLAHYPLVVVNQVLMRYRLHKDNTHRDTVLMRDNILRYFDMVIANSGRYPVDAVEAAARGRFALLQGARQLYLR